MATASMVPYSNPAGNNQTTPLGLNQGKNGAIVVPSTGVMAPGTSGASANPFVPITPGAVTGSPTTSNVTGTTDGYAQGTVPGSSATAGFITNNLSNTNGQNNLQNQLTDIYGQGVGASLFSLLNNISGTNSTILQEYINSLAPQEATGQANINASLGAAGVSANSTVAGIADANLQSQEFANISSEAAGLTQSQEDLTAQILTGMEPSAQKEVSTTPLSIFGDVMDSIGSDASTIPGGLGKGGFFNGGSGTSFDTSSAVLAGAQSYATVPGSMDTTSTNQDLFL